MKNKLFDIPANPRLLTFTLRAYHGNRLAVKITNLLRDGKIYTVKRLRNQKDFTTFELSIMSEKDKKDSLRLLIQEIVSYIPDNFPPNYIFWVNDQPLGSVNSFSITIDDEIVNFSHKIKEMNKHSILPEQQIFNKL